MTRSTKFTRRDFLLTAGAGAAGIALTGTRSRAAKLDSMKEMLVYVGTYTSGGAKGIYLLKFDLVSGALSLVKTIGGITEPSFLALDTDQRYLYAVNELVEFNGKPGGAVSAFSIDRKDGGLKFIDQVASLGGAPCNLIGTKNNKFVLAANYMGGNAAVFPVRADGGLGESVSLVQHTGTGPNKDRQEAAHVHSVTLDAHERFAFVADLGVDKIVIYKFDAGTGKLSHHSDFSAKPGSGPRHFTFHQNGKFAYLINELACTITVLSYDASAGALTEIQSLPTLPADFTDQNTCADIHIHPSGKFIYGSNRGHDSIVSFAIDEKTGKLTYIEHTATGGKTPRNFAIDPTGKFLLAANQNSGSITVFAIDTETGRLSATGKKIDIPAPVCLKLVPNFTG
ncbi:MAG: lactonase family protein [Acidobacteriota bacterium]